MSTEIDAAPSSVQFQNGDTALEEIIEEDSVNGIEAKNNSVRILKKPKRFRRQSSGSDSHSSNGDAGVVNGDKDGLVPLAVRKNSRKSRDGKGRGLPKKGGAGGKGTWGAPGDELLEDGRCQDSHDPNYDSESEDEYVVEKIDLEVTPEELRNMVEPVILEYFDHSDTKEVEDSLREMNLGRLKPRVLELIINISLDHKAPHRELSSVLISDLYGKVFTMDEIAKGFDEVLTNLNDLVIDTPDAPEVVGMFIARAIADDCLPPRYVSSQKGVSDCANVARALEKADLLLNMKHGLVRLDNIWGTGGGIRPVKYLVRQMIMLLKEYLSSGEIPEATRCLQELEVPHFHHELVYEATYMVLEDGSERAAEKMCTFLKSLADAVIITPEQFTQGYKRVFDALPDITLDIPNAYPLLERFANLCHVARILSTEQLDEIPQRGRKRFVSEGDGGVIKEQKV